MFALGIGTKTDHAEQLIAAFKVLCQQCQIGQGPTATDPQQANVGKLHLVPTAIHQQLLLRDAFFACTVRSVHVTLLENLRLCAAAHVCILCLIESYKLASWPCMQAL